MLVALLRKPSIYDRSADWRSSVAVANYKTEGQGIHMRVIERWAVSRPVLAAAMPAICILAAVAFFTCAAPSVPTAAAAPSGPTIVLIGGDKQGYPRTEHDYPDGILSIER